MLRVSFSPQSKVHQKRFKSLIGRFSQYRSKILSMPFAQLPWSNIRPLEHLRLGKKFKHLAVIGMGGASLGAKALTEALKKKIIFLDNVDPDFFHNQLNGIDLKKALFLFISKSGETIEVISLAKILIKKIGTPQNFLVVTDKINGTLGQLARRHRIATLPSPKNVPGRFSVLSIVGLLPAKLAGVNISKVHEGAQKTNWKEAYHLACHQYLEYQQKKNITVFFPYAEALHSFSDWYIQLLAESVGKSKRIGLTPTKAMGVKDQHSQLQLFLDGPDDKFTIFLKTEMNGYDERIPEQKYTLQKLFDAEYQGVKSAFKKRGKSFGELLVNRLDEETLGQLFFFFELEVAFLGALLKINIKNQPAVELSKRITKTLLK